MDRSRALLLSDFISACIFFPLYTAVLLPYPVIESIILIVFGLLNFCKNSAFPLNRRSFVFKPSKKVSCNLFLCAKCLRKIPEKFLQKFECVFVGKRRGVALLSLILCEMEPVLMVVVDVRFACVARKLRTRDCSKGRISGALVCLNS